MSAHRLSGLAHMKINRSRCEKLHKSKSELTKLVQEFGKSVADPGAGVWGL